MKSNKYRGDLIQSIKKKKKQILKYESKTE